MASIEAGISEIEFKTVIADAIQTSASLGGAIARASFDPVYRYMPERSTEDADVWFEHLDPEAPAEFKEIPRPRCARSIRFHSLISFVQAVTDEEERRNTNNDFSTRCLLVDVDTMRAQWNMNGYEERDVFTLPLTVTEEYTAFKKLCAGVYREELWRLLATDLHGCMPEKLLLQIATLQVFEDAKADIMIQPSGLKTGESSKSMKISYTDPKEGPKSTDLSLDFAYEGTVWDCFHEKVTVQTRMIIEKREKGLFFQFFPRGLNRIITDHRNRLVADLMERLIGNDCTIPIYQGAYKS